MTIRKNYQKLMRLEVTFIRACAWTLCICGTVAMALGCQSPRNFSVGKFSNAESRSDKIASKQMPGAEAAPAPVSSSKSEETAQLYPVAQAAAISDDWPSVRSSSVPYAMKPSLNSISDDGSESQDDAETNRDGSNLPRLSLDEAIAACLENDPVLRVGFQEIALAQANLCTSSLKPNPELEIIQSLLPLGRPFNEDDRQGGPPQFDVGLSYPMDWYLFGKRVAAMRSASAEVRVSRAEYQDLVRVRVLEAALAYYDVVEAQALVDLARQDVENFLAVEQIAEIAVENGAVPRVELNRIRLDRLNSQQALREAQRDVQVAKAELQVLMGGFVPGVISGSPPTSDFRVDDIAQETSIDDLVLLTDDLSGLIALARQNRPDIQALNLRIAQRQAEMELERRNAYPEVTPSFGYTRQFQQRAIGFPDVSSWGVGLAMTLPVNDRNQGNRQRAFASYRQDSFQLQSGLIDLQAEVQSIHAELNTSSANAKAIAQDQLQLAEEVRDSIRRAYEAGGRPLIDVLDSQRNYRETYANFISSRADYLRAVKKFNAVMGQEMIQ
jgi:cobalt-zinc-cadmium efflux system outer membrane protein